jgi:flagellum-specific peptidoglycan hydrolase FlgJ
MHSASKPSWQKVTALVSLSASGTVTGFSFVPHSPTDLMSPTSMPVRLMALERSVQPAASGDAALRSAVVNVANYYLRMAEGKTPAEMEAIIWQHDSVNGVDHGESCAAFASLTLELAAQVVGQQSWVTGGTSYPWPLQKWADVRVDPNPSSPNIISVLQDAEAHGRWHPLGDGYQPQPGDWVLFDNHVEVVTRDAAGTLHTIGGDSLPNFSVNAHEYPGPLSGDGVVGFVNNGTVPAPSATATATSSDSADFPAANNGVTSGVATSNDAATGHAGSIGGAARHAASSGAAAGDAAIPGATSASVVGQTSTSIPGTTSTATSGSHSAHAPANRATRQAPDPEHRASRPATAVSAHPSRTLPTVPGVATAASNASASDDPAIPGTPTSMTPVNSAHQAHRDHVPAHSGTSVRHGAIPPRQAHESRPRPRAAATADVPGMDGSAEPAATARDTASGSAAVPGLAGQQSTATTRYQRHEPAQATAPVHDTSSQQAFIDEIAPGAIATQQKYGIPAAVTIAQAIDESGWGQSQLATQDNNLFGIKGAGPAGSDSQPTREYENGKWITINARFRVYDNVNQSIDDHGKLLATSRYYTRAMADHTSPNAFANALTGVYATNPSYGGDLIQLMQQYNLYRYDASATGNGATSTSTTGTGITNASGTGATAANASGTGAGGTGAPRTGAGGANAPAKAIAKPDKPVQPSLPGLMPTASPSPTPTPAPSASQTSAPTRSTPQAQQAWSPAAAGTAANDHVSGRAGGSQIPGTTAAAPAPTPTSGSGSPAPSSRRPQPQPPRTAQAQPSRTRQPQPARTAQPQRSRTAQAQPAQTPQRQQSRAGQAQPSRRPQPQPSRTPQPRTSQTAKARVAPNPEPIVSGTYEAGWAAGSGIAMGTAMTQLRRRTKRSQRGSAVEPDDQTAHTTVSSTLSAFDRPLAPDRGWPAEPAPERPWPAEPDPDRAPVRRYQHRLPTSVKNDFVAMARGPLLHGELLYRDIADNVGLSWELLAACDWMQCQARPRYSPVHGEKLGARNHDGSVYWSRSEALGQCAVDLVGLADAVYGIDLTTELQLSVADLARVFAAFRWGALLKRHRTSAMEFPYSVAGLTVQHMNMRWPNIGDPNTPDKPGARFRKPFGAVPVVLSLHYPATV